MSIADRLRHTFAPLYAADRATLDPAFYGKYYGDLSHLKSKAALFRHFVTHGKGEGRFPNRQAAEAHYARQGRNLPDGFNVELFKQLNPDLNRRFDEPWQFELHYLELGETESTRYAVFEHAGTTKDWHPLFSYYDFLLSSASWREETEIDRDTALALFEVEGIERLTPLARDLAFDPEFYVQHYAMTPSSAAVLYRDWLETGIRRGRSPNEGRAIFNYLGTGAYPDAFDWRRFARTTHNTPTYPTKIQALADLFENPLTDRARLCIADATGGRLYSQIGDYHLVRGAFRIAADCYDLACARGEAGAAVHLHRGDAYRSISREGEALKSYKESMTFPIYSIWALVHTVRLTTMSGSADVAFTLLLAERSKWIGDPFYRSVVDECIELRFRQISDVTRKLMEAGDVAAGNAYADRELADLTSAIRALKSIEPVALPNDPHRVVMLACLDLPQCKHYRVDQKVEQLALLGITLEVYDMQDPAAFMSALPGACAAIFYRVPSYPAIVEAVLRARGFGIATFYDIDDLVFSADFPDDFESYEGQIDLKTFFDLRTSVPFYRHVISLCDVGLASTGPLARRLGKIVLSGRAHVVPNALGADADALAMIGEARSPNDVVTIFYGSGTKAHNRDFNLGAGPALVDVMSTYPQVRLVIVGHLTLSSAFRPFESRITRFPIVEDRARYAALLSACDINLSVLAPGPLADCKSEIKWLEAAILGLPTIVSRTETYDLVLDSPRDGLIADDMRSWSAHLGALVRDADLRKTIGASAREKALRAYGSASVAATLHDALGLSVRRRQNIASRDRRRMKILICNVFFAPQSHGGATRVVEANVDYFIDRLSSDFEVAILATDHGAPAGRFSIDSYRGCRVFRISTPVEINMDWRPFNEEIVPDYRRVLDLFKPDLVHFHCIQRLTASIVAETLRREIPYVVTVHDAWWLSDHQFLIDQNDAPSLATADAFSMTLPQDVTRLESVVRRSKLRALLKTAARVMPVSRSFGDLYRKAGIDRIHVIANGLGTLPPRLPPTTRHDKLVLGHLGGRTVHKGAVLLESVLRDSALTSLELLLVDGTIENGHQTQALWGGTEVTSRGYCPQSRINELFASIDVLIAPSIWPESFGLVVREAQFYGKVVVVSNRGALADDLVQGDDAFIIDVGTRQDLDDVLSQMNRDPLRYKTTGGKDRVFRSADDQAEELAALYREVIVSAEVIPSFDLQQLCPA